MMRLWKKMMLLLTGLVLNREYIWRGKHGYSASNIGLSCNFSHHPILGFSSSQRSVITRGYPPIHSEKQHRGRLLGWSSATSVGDWNCRKGLHDIFISSSWSGFSIPMKCGGGVFRSLSTARLLYIYGNIVVSPTHHHSQAVSTIYQFLIIFGD